MKEFLGEAGYKAHEIPRRKAGKEKQGGEERPRRPKKKTKKQGQEAASQKKHAAARRRRTRAAGEPGEAEGENVARHVGGGFPIYYPTRPPEGATYQESNPYEHIVDPRVYHLKDKDKEPRGPTGWSAPTSPDGS